MRARPGKAAIFEQFAADGITYMFGNPGTVEQGFLDESRNHRLTYVPTLHEGAAVGIADGAATAAVGITHLVRRSIRLVGSYGGRTRTDMPALIRLIEAGAVSVDAQISTRVPLDDAGQVYEALDRGAIVGRALVVP